MSRMLEIKLLYYIYIYYIIMYIVYTFGFMSNKIVSYLILSGSHVGIGSRSHVLLGEESITSRTSSQLAGFRFRR